MHLVSLRESCFSVFGGQRPSFPDFLLSHSNNLRLVLLQGCSANRGSRFPQLRFTISQPPAVYWPEKNSYYSSHIQNVLSWWWIRGVCEIVNIWLKKKKKGSENLAWKYFWQKGYLVRWSESLIDLWSISRHTIISTYQVLKKCCDLAIKTRGA